MLFSWSLFGLFASFICLWLKSWYLQVWLKPNGEVWLKWNGEIWLNDDNTIRHMHYQIQVLHTLVTVFKSVSQSKFQNDYFLIKELLIQNSEMNTHISKDNFHISTNNFQKQICIFPTKTCHKLVPILLSLVYDISIFARVWKKNFTDESKIMEKPSVLW